MKATLREYGGPIDPLGRRAYVADAASMPEAMAKKFAELVMEAQARQPVADIRGAHGGDMMTYTITVEQDGQSNVLRQSDAVRTDAFVELQNWLKRNGKRI